VKGLGPEQLGGLDLAKAGGQWIPTSAAWKIRKIPMENLEKIIGHLQNGWVYDGKFPFIDH